MRLCFCSPCKNKFSKYRVDSVYNPDVVFFLSCYFYNYIFADCELAIIIPKQLAESGG